MRESRTYGSVRGVLGNRDSYRAPSLCGVRFSDRRAILATVKGRASLPASRGAKRREARNSLCRVGRDQ